MTMSEAKSSSYSNDVSASVNSHHDDDQDELDMVFQCSQCNSIVGDSKAWKSTNEILRTVSLRCASNKVRITEKLLTSKTGDDIGSTYSLLQCEVCQDEIGKLYRTTPCHLDSIRGNYTFYVDKLSSYQIGSNEDSKDPLNLSDALTLSDTKRLHQQVQKLQAVILCLDQRVKYIENVMSEESEDISPQQVNGLNNGFENNASNPRDKAMEHQSQNGHTPYTPNRLANFPAPHAENVASSSIDIQKTLNSPVDHLKRKLEKMSREKVSSTSDKKRKRLM